MSKVPSSFTTEKGTVLPLTNLKGKPYLMVAHRFVWLTEKHDSYTVTTEPVKLEDGYAIIRASVVINNTDGTVLKSATATKREDAKSFPDFLEKAETGAIGRALAMLGIGTQFCEADLDEETRLADSPVAPLQKAKPASTNTTNPANTAKTGSFNKNANKPKEEVTETKKEVTDDAWT